MAADDQLGVQSPAYDEPPGWEHQQEEGAQLLEQQQQRLVAMGSLPLLFAGGDADGDANGDEAPLPSPRLDAAAVGGEASTGSGLAQQQGTGWQAAEWLWNESGESQQQHSGANPAATAAAAADGDDDASVAALWRELDVVRRALEDEAGCGSDGASADDGGDDDAQQQQQQQQQQQPVLPLRAAAPPAPLGAAAAAAAAAAATLALRPVVRRGEATAGRALRAVVEVGCVFVPGEGVSLHRRITHGLEKIHPL